MLQIVQFVIDLGKFSEIKRVRTTMGLILTTSRLHLLRLLHLLLLRLLPLGSQHGPVRR